MVLTVPLETDAYAVSRHILLVTMWISKSRETDVRIRMKQKHCIHDATLKAHVRTSLVDVRLLLWAVFDLTPKRGFSWRYFASFVTQLPLKSRKLLIFKEVVISQKPYS